MAPAKSDLNKDHEISVW